MCFFIHSSLVLTIYLTISVIKTKLPSITDLLIYSSILLPYLDWYRLGLCLWSLIANTVLCVHCCARSCILLSFPNPFTWDSSKKLVGGRFFSCRTVVILCWASLVAVAFLQPGSCARLLLAYTVFGSLGLTTLNPGFLLVSECTLCISCCIFVFLSYILVIHYWPTVLTYTSSAIISLTIA